MSRIYAKNICKSYGKKTILDAVDLEVKENEFVVLLGPSGCGKSTLLRIIAGLETQDTGDVFIGERCITGLSPRDRKLSMVFQNYAVFPHMTVAENIGFGLAMQKAPQAKIDAKVKQTAELMHLEDYLDRYSGQLSGGQRQRVAVARALATEPEVLLMDEPLSNLDALLRLEMRAELKTILRETKTTTIYVTHDQVEAMSLADRIAVMNDTVIQQFDKPSAIYHSPATAFIGGFIGNPPMNFLDLANFPFAQPPAGARRGGVRPENVTITKEKRENSWEARVTVVESLGPHQQLMTTINGEHVRVTAENDLEVAIGDAVHITPILEKITWYDANNKAI